ncbi:MAG TPA: CRISPR-associated endonuclease Cas1 [Candidatus Sulfotelmatobacter sp.]
MAAKKTVSQFAQFLNSVPRHGVLTLVGYGIQVRVDKGHLVIQDGIGADRCNYRLPRVGHGLKRLVVVGSDGQMSLTALRWLRDQDVTFSFLERNGKVLCVTGPVGSSNAKLRRAQAFAISNGVGLEICRTLIIAKIQGEENVLRDDLNCPATADAIARVRSRLSSADSFDVIRNLEANAAALYFREWRDLPVSWPKADLQKLPNHWRTVGSRQSPLTGGPRLAVTPVHAILNYVFALLEAETRLAIASLGLDVGLGLGLHTDTADRSSLAFDVLEPVRPEVERWLLSWIASEPLRRADFFETTTGNARLMSHMCTKLSETASIWGKLVAPWAEYVAQTLSANMKCRRARTIVSPTRLTQQRRTEAKGKIWITTVEAPKSDHLCRGCGSTITNGRSNCAECAIGGATERLVSAAKLGRVAARSPEARAKHSASRVRHALACSEWDASRQPDWLTTEVFTKQIQPLLANVPASAIRSRIGVSRWYAGKIRKGYVPHPRHWLKLAQLVGAAATRLQKETLSAIGCPHTPSGWTDT